MKFWELEKPTEYFFDDGYGYAIMTKLDSSFYLTNDERGVIHVVDALEDCTDLYFKSEYEAHRAACQYYLDNGVPEYPYAAEYIESARDMGSSVTVEKTVEPKVMEF